MKNRFFIPLITALLITPLCNGQDIYNPYNHFKTIFESSTKANPYYFSNNPAYLNYDGRDELLSIQGNYNNTSGDFKTFFDPGTERNYDLAFSGKKKLDSTQTFKGYFAIKKLQRNDWHFLAVRDYDTGSPFLLGDVTTGDTRYNGIFMNAQYCAGLFERLLTGFSVSYYVDEGLKEIAPRPTSDHRDIDLTVGLGYLVTDKLSIGGSLRAYDLNEKIVYEEDEEAVYTETLLFKFRGYDLPQMILKKRETRISYHNGYHGNFDAFYQDENLSASLYAGGGFEHITLKDNITNPEPEGYWRQTYLNAGLQVQYNLNNEWNAGALYKFIRNESWAKHPLYNVLLDEQENNLHEFILGLQYTPSSRLSLGLEVASTLSDVNHHDYYSSVDYQKEKFTITPLLGISYVWSDLLKTHLAFGYTNSSNNNIEISDDNTSLFYQVISSMDIRYLITDYTGKNLYLKAEINPGFLGLFNIYIAYQKIDANENPAYNFHDRTEIQTAIELKIKAY